MKPRDIFGIIVRTIGLALVMCAGWYVIFGMAILAGLQDAYSGTLASYLLTGIPAAVVGIYFLQGAPLLMDFSYGPEPSSKE